MFWKKKLVPPDWRIGDTVKGDIFSDITTAYIVSINPLKNVLIVRDVSDNLFRVSCNHIDNVSLQNRQLKEEVVNWEDYNKALKELQDKFNL